MPKTTKGGKAKKSELPSTLQRSDDKAQRTFAKAHDAAADQYGDEQRAHRVAYSAVKHSFEKVGDHWEPKEKRGPSDQLAEGGGPQNSGQVRRRRGRQCQQETSAGHRATARCARPLDHEQAGTRRRHQEAQPPSTGTLSAQSSPCSASATVNGRAAGYSPAREFIGECELAEV